MNTVARAPLSMLVLAALLGLAGCLDLTPTPPSDASADASPSDAATSD